ncbi:hypothetical protein SSBR45G_54320 [Bradyrhizobium sp. SSBR45G]|uniref:hypothetical protein n=1 Tax=unclassified Bradyrhizobium TaxID=2631580 RepID=UPI0023428E7D|nr:MULTISPECIES: hypothetical protein [unclassified Bradyrhizobium]GLH80523.1 hypothetical protein SSBR45G_54320 [Bradyrhizobium sp. SSBR45G]GLH87918.1 hypothetical protein SSBR45R_53780 [Bradyrhizobium sp. SSBR45R]
MSFSRAASAVCVAIGLGLALGLGPAGADTIARYDCTIIGTMGLEPIGDRPGHMLVSFQYSCFGTDGLMKGATYTASVASEWESQKGTYLYGAGIHRTPDGYAVAVLTDGTGSVVMKNGAPAMSEATGKVAFKLASGRFASLAGRTANFTARLVGPGHLIYELTD